MPRRSMAAADREFCRTTARLLRSRAVRGRVTISPRLAELLARLCDREAVRTLRRGEARAPLCTAPGTVFAVKQTSAHNRRP